MTANVLIRGTLFRPPEAKTSKAGKPYFNALLKVKDGDSVEWWRLVVFSQTAGDELMRLQDGDALAAQGSVRAEVYHHDGEARIRLTCMCDQILPLRAAKKTRRPSGKDIKASDMRTRAERIAGAVASLSLGAVRV